MTYPFPIEALSGGNRRFEVCDITILVAVRAHEHNEWVMDRLRRMTTWYDPMPRMVVVDFGSGQGFAERIADICTNAGVELVYVEDDGLFSAGRARNLGFAHVVTDLVFFCDVDCFGPSDLPTRLAEHATHLELDACFDQIVNLPVHHLCHAATVQIERPDDVARALARSPSSKRGQVSTFVAPYSNVYLCHRRFFDLVGGYDEGFRGHGSEDFELLMRMALVSRQFPLPHALAEDSSGPLTEAFFGLRPYRGFRRLFEVMAYSSEVAGLRVAHLHHAKPKRSDWYARHDNSRKRFSRAVGQVVRDHQYLLDKDWLPRERTALVATVYSRNFRYLLPLRLAGYRLVPFRLREEEPAAAVRTIQNREIDTVVAFRPELVAHASMRPLLDAAIDAGVERIDIRPAELPGSFRFGSPAERTIGDADREQARAYLESWPPERLDVGEVAPRKTRKRLESLREGRAFLVQLDGTEADDAELAAAVAAAAAAHPELSFVVRPTPLRPIRPRIETENIFVCRWDDHVTTLLERCEGVICARSPVGLWAALSGKPVVTLADPTWATVAHTADSFDAGLSLLLDGFELPDPTDFLARALAELSFFCGEPVMKNPGGELVAELEDPFFQQLVVGSFALRTRRARHDAPVADDSYVSARTGAGVAELPTPPPRPPRSVRSLLRELRDRVRSRLGKRRSPKR